MQSVLSNFLKLSELDVTGCLWCLCLNKLLKNYRSWNCISPSHWTAICSRLRGWERDIVGCLCLIFPAVEADVAKKSKAVFIKKNLSLIRKFSSCFSMEKILTSRKLNTYWCSTDQVRVGETYKQGWKLKAAGSLNLLLVLLAAFLEGFSVATCALWFVHAPFPLNF